ncbi:MAG: VOC family protein [Acidimicrobiia bacterium]
MRTLGLHHTAVNVEDLDEALDFYVGVLGMHRRTDRPALRIDGAWLDTGQEQVHLVCGDVPPDHGQHIALLVEDLPAAVAELGQAGYEVSPIVTIGSSIQAFLHDPSGNRVELHQRVG